MYISSLSQDARGFFVYVCNYIMPTPSCSTRGLIEIKYINTFFFLQINDPNLLLRAYLPSHSFPTSISAEALSHHLKNEFSLTLRHLGP